MTRSKTIMAALALGALTAFVLVPPVLGFYWGWNTPVRTAGGTWNPWVVALSQMFMGWVIYPLQLVEGDLLSDREGRSVAIAFVVTTVLAGAAIYPGLGRRTP